MRMEDRERLPAIESCPCENPVALMLTHERPGLLTQTVASFWNTTCAVPLYLFDDGSQDPRKLGELKLVGATGVKVQRLPPMGFAKAWLEILRFAKDNLSRYDSLVLLEDDLIFARGWLETLQAMQKGITGIHLGQGMVSCFRPHDSPQTAVVDLGGVEAYQSMAHTFHVNLMPMSVLRHFEVIEESVEEVLATSRGLGLDVYLVGNLAHRLKRVSFVSMQSWVAHIGTNSVVEGQGFGPCRHVGFNLVPELEQLAERWRERGVR